MSKVIYPGTFDPITLGHLDIIERSARLFAQVFVAVAQNPSKKPLFTLEQRIDLAQTACQHLPNVQVFGFSDLLANVVREQQITAIIRGVRTTTDFEYELQLAQLNYALTNENQTGVETLFLPPRPQWSYLSSTAVREIFLHGGSVEQFVPPNVWQALQKVR